MTVSPTPHSGPYIGRFAPSPSGALHFGSLLAALASYLDARARGGLWLLRMEDLDPAREPPGAADEILRLLDAMHLHWDGEVIYQSARLEAYEQALQQLADNGLTFHCICSRKRVRELGGIYDGRCRSLALTDTRPTAIRLRVEAVDVAFTDLIQGPVRQNLASTCGDFIIRRKDALFSYQLAVVVDDAWQQISHIIRGHDLLDSTPRQIALQRALGFQTPVYAHIPVASNTLGQKLSKQHFATPLDPARTSLQLFQALTFLGQQPPPTLLHETAALQLQWATEHWDIQKVPALANMLFEE